MIFVDTGALYAAAIRDDANHSRASTWLNTNQARLISTNFIIAETLTLMRARRHDTEAMVLSRQLRQGEILRMEWVREADFEFAWKLFDNFRDKQWSFVDCTSRVVMERLGIRSAFCFDKHFRQFGTVTIVP